MKTIIINGVTIQVASTAQIGAKSSKKGVKTTIYTGKEFVQLFTKKFDDLRIVKLTLTLGETDEYEVLIKVDSSNLSVDHTEEACADVNGDENKALLTMLDYRIELDYEKGLSLVMTRYNCLVVSVSMS